MSSLAVPPASTPSTQGIGDLLADTVTDEQLARELGVALITIRKWSAAGKLPPKLPLPGRMPRRSRAAIAKMFAGERPSPSSSKRKR